MIYWTGLAISMEEITNLLGVIIWPGTLLLIILIYKKHFVSAFNRLGSLKADATGISMEFNEKIDAVKEIAKDLKSGIQFKGGDGIDIATNTTKRTPYHQLLDLKVELTKKVENLAVSNEISVQKTTADQLINALVNKEIVNSKTAALIIGVYDLILAADQTLSAKQYNEVHNLYLAIDA